MEEAEVERQIAREIAVSSSRSAREALKAKLAGSLTAMRDLFREWDVDGSGTIDKAEFRRAVAALGLPTSAEACDMLFDDYDVDGSGELACATRSRSRWRA